MLVHGEGTPPAWATRPEWRAVTAVRGRHFVYMHGSAFERPSLRAPDVVRQLAAELRTSR